MNFEEEQEIILRKIVIASQVIEPNIVVASSAITLTIEPVVLPPKVTPLPKQVVIRLSN